MSKYGFYSEEYIENKKNFFCALNAKIKINGINQDPNYFEHCLTVIFPAYDNYNSSIIATFIKDMQCAASDMMKRGVIEGRELLVDVLVNPFLRDSKIKEAEFIIESITGNTRSYWMTKMGDAIL